MRPKFSKALLAAGLAAALVGCGGGSSNTTMADPPAPKPTPDPGPTPAEVAANTVQRVYDAANAQVTGLTVDSSTSDIADARTAVSDLRKALSTPNLSSEKTEDFNTKANNLSAMITQKETDIANAETRRQNELSMMAKTDSWMAGISNPTLSAIGMWPQAAIDAGAATPVKDVRKGWDVHGYEYTKGGMDEHGKTFKMEKTSTTDSVEVDWKILAYLQTEDPEDFLGKDVLMSDETSLIGGDAGAGGQTGTTGMVSIELDSLSVPGTATPLENKLTTKIHKDHVGSWSGTRTGARVTNNAQVFNTSKETHEIVSDQSEGRSGIIAATTNLDTRGLDANLFGRNGYFHCGGGDGDSQCIISFNDDGYLEVSVASADGEALPLTVTTPTLSFVVAPNSNGNISDLNEHEITFRKSATRTNVTEFAYWGSTNSVADNNGRFTTAVKTFAKSSGFHHLTLEPATLTGKATYTGLAAGYYGMTSDEEFSHGEFTANAELEADFTKDTLMGTIDTFKPITGEDDLLSDWTLSLGSVDIDNDDFGATLTGRTTSTGASKSGAWNAQLLGMANMDSDIRGVADDMTDNYPEGVVGTFNGHFTNGQVAGAFGADYTE